MVVIFSTLFSDAQPNTERILAAKYIADNPAQPRWKTGDKYEAAWKDLYSKPK
jgi:hypothetical protein